MHNEVRETAVQWFVKLRATDVSSADRHLHSEWLHSNEENQQAYDLVCAEWSDLDELDTWARGELGQLNLANNARSQKKTTHWVSGLAVAAAIILSVVLWPVFQDQSQYYQTVKSEQRLITLEDGSRLHLNTASAVSVNFESELREITLSQGEGVFDVEHDSVRPFVVRAGSTRVISLGTRFSVEHRGMNEIEVTVLEGRVAIVPDNVSQKKVLEHYSDPDVKLLEEVRTLPESLILGPDQQVTIRIDGIAEQIHQVIAANEMAWLEGKLVFNETPLREVAHELSRYVPGQIRVANEVPDHPVTGIIQIRSTETMLDLLSQVVPITPVKQSASVTVLHAVPILQRGT
jgi:transmembrane sensor